MKIFLYKIVVKDGESDLTRMLQSLRALDISERLKETNTSTIRLEDAVHARTGPWRLDFTKFRSSGPGRSAESSPTTDFDLGDDEYFGEETAALYFPPNNLLVLQYNHFGPRASAIESYLNICAQDCEFDGRTGTEDIALLPVVRNDSASQLMNATLVKRFDVKLYVPGALSVRRKTRKALGDFLNDPVISSAQTISFQISAGHGSPLNVTEVKSWVANLLGIREAVEHLAVKVVQNDEDPSEIIDLLENRLISERTIEKRGKGRYERTIRWSVLQDVYDEWNRSGMLP